MHNGHDRKRSLSLHTLYGLNFQSADTTAKISSEISTVRSTLQTLPAWEGKLEPPLLIAIYAKPLVNVPDRDKHLFELNWPHAFWISFRLRGG